MMGGAECSTSSNPLSSLLKQQQQDHSLHHQGFAGPGPAGPSASSMRSHTHTPPAHLQGDADADRFFHPHPHAPAAPPLAIDAMRRELENVSRGATPGGALKGDRGALSSAPASKSPHVADTSPHARAEWASQYQPAGSSLSPADLARMEEQFRMQQHQGMPSDFGGPSLLSPHSIPPHSSAPGTHPAFRTVQPSSASSSTSRRRRRPVQRSRPALPPRRPPAPCTRAPGSPPRTAATAAA